MSGTAKLYKLGDLRDDGRVFLCVANRKFADGTPFQKEVWLRPEAYTRARFNVALQSAKARAKKKGVAFEIDIDYIISLYPKDGLCPVFGFPMVFGEEGGQDSSPSLDRIVPTLGYVEGNVMWVSGLANKIKSDATPDQLRIIADFYADLHTIGH